MVFPKPVYTRVSTDVQAGKDEGSLDTQEARLRAFLQSRPGEHEVRQVFREEGASGKSLDRPALQQLMRAIKRDEIDLIVVTRLDRLSRSLLDFYELHRLFEKHDVRFVSLNETFDTSTPVGRAMLKLVLVFAELEREQTAERTRQAMRARAERGLWNGGAPPLGYDSQGNGHLDVNAHEAELVRLIFDKYLELRSAPQVAKRLNAQGQNVIEGNSKNWRGPPLRSQHDWPLTGVAQCACGYALTSSAGTGRGGRTYFYYRCVGLQKNVDHPCDVRQIRAELLEDAVFALVREAALEPTLLAEAVEEANRMATEHVVPLRDRVATLRRELSDVEDEGQRTLRQIPATGVADSDLARGLLADIEARRDALRPSVATAEGELAAKKTEHLDLELVTQAIQGFDDAFEHLTSAEKREFLQLLVHKATVHRGRVDVELYDGRYASRYLARVTRNGVVIGPGDPEGGGNADDDTTVKGFSPGEEWLPLLDSNQRHSD